MPKSIGRMVEDVTALRETLQRTNEVLDETKDLDPKTNPEKEQKVRNLEQSRLNLMSHLLVVLVELVLEMCM